MKKEYWVAFLIGIYFPLGELHLFWQNDYSQYDVFYARELTVDVAWLVKDLSSMVQQICLGIVLIIVLPRFGRKMVAFGWIYTCFCLVDLLIYFYDKRQSFYGFIYLYIAFIFIIIFIRRNGQKRDLG